MTNKYQPIKAPITPEREAAMKQLQEGMEMLAKVALAPIVKPTKFSGLVTNKPKQIDYESHRDDFELWILGNFYCPKGLGQFTRNPDGTYVRVAYDKKDSLHFSNIESLWQAFKLGLRTDLS